MGSLSSQDRTTAGDRLEVVVTDETSGLNTNVLSTGGINRLAVDAIISAATSDAFNRVKIGEPTNLFESTFRIDASDVYWDEDLTGSATITHNSTQVSMTLATTSSTGDKAILQSRRYIPYFPGKSQTAILTGNMLGGISGVTKRFGLFDEQDGPFFQIKDGTYYVCLRSYITGSAVTTEIAQSNWNLDKLDGTGTTGLTIDLSKQQIFIIDFQWLGSGKVRFGFNVGGSTVYCHEISNANILTTPYSRTGTLPVRCEVENVSASGSDSMRFTCSSVVSDGGESTFGRVRSFDFSEGAEIPISTTESALFAVRLNPSYNRSSVKPLKVNILMSSGSAVARYRAVTLPTISATWTTVSDSIVQYAAYDDITSYSGGTQVLVGHIPPLGKSDSLTANTIQSDYYLGKSIDGTSDVLLFLIEMIAGNGKVLGDFSYREYL